MAILSKCSWCDGRRSNFTECVGSLHKTLEKVVPGYSVSIRFNNSTLFVIKQIIYLVVISIIQPIEFPVNCMIFFCSFLPESPRWLLRNKKVKEAHSVFEKMAKLNGRNGVSMETLEKIIKQEELTCESQQKNHVSYLDFLRTKNLLKPTIFLLALWFSWNVSYYGISYNIRNVPGNRYFNLGLIGLAIVLGQRSSMVACDR